VTGALLALLSAASFGLNNAMFRRGALGGSVLQALAITVPLGVPLFALGCLIFGAFGALGTLPPSSWAWMSAAGVTHFIIGRYGNYRATRAMGAALSSPIQQLSVLVALALAFTFLDEYLTPLRAAGIVLVLFGPVIILRRRVNRPNPRQQPVFVVKYAEGFAWGLVCAVGYGTSPLFIRFGLEASLESHGIRDSIAGGLISYAAASLVIGLILLVPGNIAHFRTLEPTAARWFTASGVFVFLSQLFRYMALAVAPVSVVQPVQRTSVVFRVIFAWALNRDHEVLTVPVLIGIGISLIGVLALTVSTEFVLAVIPLPDAVAAIARLTWP
jgi:drug/metabolite transporter (DMT)-like permease